MGKKILFTHHQQISYHYSCFFFLLFGVLVYVFLITYKQTETHWKKKTEKILIKIFFMFLCARYN